MPGHNLADRSQRDGRRAVQLTSLPIINRAVAERERLLGLRAAVEADRLQVTIASNYQDDAMAALVRPVLIGELNGRIRALERDLVSMGVDVA